jgi:hypothetical protein
MKLPHPFNKASGVKADAQGSINLVDDQGKSLARIPMTTAFELSPEAEGHGDHGFGSGYGSGNGNGSGYGYGYGYGFGNGSGQRYGQTDGSGGRR